MTQIRKWGKKVVESLIEECKESQYSMEQGQNNTTSFEGKT